MASKKQVLESTTSIPTGNNSDTIAEIARGFGELLGKSERAKFDAGIKFGSLVKSGDLKAEDSLQWARWYDEGACRANPLRLAMSDKSLGVNASKFKGFAHELVIALGENAYAAVESYMKGKDRKTLGKDFFEIVAGVNAGIKKAHEEKKPIAAVTESFVAQRLAKKPVVEATPPKSWHPPSRG